MVVEILDLIDFILMLTIPSVFFINFLSEEIIIFLFQRGAFSLFSSENTSQVLKILTFGLPAFILIKLFQTKFYAALNTKIPVIVSTISISINIIISFSLMYHMKYLSVVIASIITAWINIIMLIIL